MKKYRLMAVLMLAALLVGLCACGAKGDDLKTLLTTYSWEFSGEVKVYLRPDGTGAQYDKNGTYIKENFRWELSGDVLRCILTNDGEEQDFATLTVERINEYALRMTDREDGSRAIFYREDAFD